MSSPRRRRLAVALDIAALPRIDEFLRGFASKAGWDDASTQRLTLVGEETLSGLLSDEGDDFTKGKAQRLIVTARSDGGAAELEFVAASGEENLEDRLAYLGEMPDIPDAREISFRLLRHYASSVRHQKYHGVDVITVRVEGPR